jgi:hypothetical protein
VILKAINKQLAKLPHNAWNQRWGLWTTMTLMNSDGEVYLFRRRLVQTPLVAVYLHDIEMADELPDLHSHPFPFVSLILRGGYVEHVAHPTMTKLGPVELRAHHRWGINVFPRGAKKVHTIVRALPRTKTLVITGRRRDSWGWFVDGEGLVHWSEFLLRQGREARDARLVPGRKAG